MLDRRKQLAFLGVCAAQVILYKLHSSKTGLEMQRKQLFLLYIDHSSCCSFIRRLTLYICLYANVPEIFMCLQT